MTIFDLILIVILSGFTLFGFWFGVVQTLGGIFGVVLGALIASRYYIAVAGFIHGYTSGSENALKVITFIILFIIINRLVGFIFYTIGQAFSIIKMLPFISGIDKLLGAIIGFAEGVLIIGICLFFASIHPFSLWLSEMILEDSVVAPYLLGIATILLPLVPEAIRELQARLPEIK